jgi:hypothetical protein
MNLTRCNKAAAKRGSQQAFTLMDALFAILISGMMFTAMYAGLAFGFKTIKMARENTRATQIMLEHMEICRLYKWQDLTNTSTFLNTNPFTVYYYSVGATNTSLQYTARVSLASCPIMASYAGDMRKLTIRLDWGALGTTNRTRIMSTYVARNGLQNYVW